MLWTFSAAQTLPAPEMEARPGDKSITLTIVQGGDCDDKALVHFWRVSHCASKLSSSSGAGRADTSNNRMDAVQQAVEGGSGEEYYDYYDDSDMKPASRDNKSSGQSPSRSMACVNNLHQVTDRRGVIVIDR